MAGRWVSLVAWWQMGGSSTQPLIPHNNGHNISFLHRLPASWANHSLPAPDPAHGGSAITPLKNRNPNRGLHRNRQAAFQLATSPALVYGLFHAHGGFRMGYKGRLRLGAIDTRQDVFPLHIGFQWGHEAHTCKKFFFMPTFGAFVNKSLAQPFHPPLNYVQYSILSAKKKPRIIRDPGPLSSVSTIFKNWPQELI